MPLFNANLLIKELRKAQGITQEKLAEGICSRQTITKIESGERKPDWITFKNIMLRLGVNTEKYFNDVASEDEIYSLQKFNESNNYILAFNFEALKTEIDKLEQDSRFLKGRGGELLLRLKANLHMQGTYKDTELALKYTLECIALQRPDFEIDKIPDYFLSHDEFVFVNLIAIAHKDLYGLPKAIEIWQKLKANYEKNYTATIGENIAYRDLMMNIAIALKQSERFEECLAVAEEGMSIALKYHDMRSYSRYLYQKAWCLLKLGNKHEGEEQYKKFLMFAYVLNGYANINFETVKKEYGDVFGGTLDLSITW